jgi:uroporphyrinogen-III synthase
MGFDGIRVVSLESRRATEMETLIRNQGGDPFVAPSMREVPLERNEEAFRFAERLFAGEFDMMVLLTGVGTRALDRLLATRYPAGRFAEALRSITVVARGPKPAAALREMDVPVTVSVPAPNTWREILDAVAVRTERRMAVQEYGRSNEELLAGLRALGADVTPVRIYQWDLPEDTGPLREAVRRIASGLAGVVMFTTANQVPHLFRIASEEGVEEAMRRGLGSAVVASIGPTTSEMLEEYDIQPDVVPSQSKMGILVRETAEQASGILERKWADR